MDCKECGSKLSSEKLKVFNDALEQIGHAYWCKRCGFVRDD